MFGFFFMITAWTYCLRGWLASLMVNKRRRRAIVMGITMAFILLSQLPNLVTNVWFPNKHQKIPATQNIEEMEAWQLRRAEEAACDVAIFEQVHRYVPFLWLPLGAKTLAEGSLWPAMLGFLGMSAIGGWGLARAYRGTIRFYQGGETKKAAPAVAVPRKVDAGKTLLIERALPAIPEEASAMMMASLRSMSRAPEVKMSLATHVIIFGFLGASMFFRHSADFSTALQSVKLQSWMSGGIVAATFMGLMQLMFNHFGFDRSGFRAFVLLPAPRRYLLLGKNLALLPVALAVFTVYLGVAIFFAKLAVSTVLMASFEFITAFSAMSILGNFFSILVPYRIAAGSIKPAKMTIATKFLMIIMSLILLPLAFGLIFLPVGLGVLSEQMHWLPSIAVTLTCSALLALFSAALYWLTLGPLGSLLEQREQRILQAVTQEVESVYSTNVRPEPMDRN